MPDASDSSIGPRNFVVGQRVDEAKVRRAKEFRKLMTPEERTMSNHLRNNKLLGLHFRRQQVIDGFIADFYCHAAGLVIEIDGAVHEQQADYDKDRDEIIRRRHLRVIRFLYEDVRNRIGWVLEQIECACKSNNPSPKPGGELTR
jgi:very-short-patch-repair endonuclease